MIQAGALSPERSCVSNTNGDGEEHRLPDQHRPSPEVPDVGASLGRKAKNLGLAVPKTLRTFAGVSRKAVLSVTKFDWDKKKRVQ